MFKLPIEYIELQAGEAWQQHQPHKALFCFCASACSNANSCRYLVGGTAVLKHWKGGRQEALNVEIRYGCSSPLMHTLLLGAMLLYSAI
jgi:hypothetical protein